MKVIPYEESDHDGMVIKCKDCHKSYLSVCDVCGCTYFYKAKDNYFYCELCKNGSGRWECPICYKFTKSRVIVNDFARNYRYNPHDREYSVIFNIPYIIINKKKIYKLLIIFIHLDDYNVKSAKLIGNIIRKSDNPAKLIRPIFWSIWESMVHNSKHYQILLDILINYTKNNKLFRDLCLDQISRLELFANTIFTVQQYNDLVSKLNKAWMRS